MTQLEIQQRGLLALIKERPINKNADPWLTCVADSPEVEMVRTIALWWRRYQIESQCRYTSRLLKRLDCFEADVARYFQENSTVPNIELMTQSFLRSLMDHPKPLVVSVACFELACLELATSDRSSRIIWDRDPNATLRALDNFTALPPSETGCEYVMEIGTNVPGNVACVLVSRSE